MTISIRNRILAACLILETAMAAVFGAGVFLCVRANALGAGPTGLAPEFALAVFSPTPSLRTITSLAAAGALVMTALAGGALLLRWFKKTASSEILFFGVALASLSLEGLRAFLLLSLAAPGAVFIPSVLTRAVLAARWAGMFCFLGASLYAGGLEYGKSGQAVLIAGFLSLVIGGTLPLSSGKAFESFLVQSGFLAVATAATAIMSAFSVLGYGIAAKRMGSRDFALMGAGVAAALLGRAGLFHAADPLACAISLALLASGVLLYLDRQYKRALWG